VAFEKGHQKLGGKVKGTQNKLTRTFKDLLSETIAKLQTDEAVNLEAWAKENPTEFYKIAAKLIPTEISGGLDVKTQITFRDAE